MQPSSLGGCGAALELAHQQRYREASAQAALNQVRWNIVAAELTNTATTEKLYFTALYQRDLRDLARRATIYLFPVYEMYRARWQATVNDANPQRQRLNRFRQ